MLVTDLREVGNALYRIRRHKGMTRANVAERAELSDRTYADIERGSVNMRVETLLKICHALSITPNDILTVEPERDITEAELAKKMNMSSDAEKKTAMNLLNIYLDSLNR